MNKTFKILFFLVFCLSENAVLFGQDNYLFEAEFSIKEKKKGAEKGSLVMGTVIYDAKQNHSVYQIKFPEKERWVILDTMMYQIVNDSIKKNDTIPSLGQYSFFYVILNQELSDFGLKKAGYKPAEVWNEDGKTYSKWAPPAAFSEFMQPVILMQEKKLLSGIVFLDKEENHIGRFYFQDYEIKSGVPIPRKVYQIYTLPDGDELIRLMTFKNIKINDLSDNMADAFDVPDANK